MMPRYSAIIPLLLLAACGCGRAEAHNQVLLKSAPQGSGSIHGQVFFRGAIPASATLATCQHDGAAVPDEMVVANADGSLQNALVWLEGGPLEGIKVDGSSSAPALLDQSHCRYVPHVLALQSGQLLRVRSSDATMHNVHFNPDLNDAGNLSMTKAGEEKSVTFQSAEVVRMKCDVHPWMTAYVGVFDHPFFAVTHEDGVFELKNIPAGSYRLVAWHERFGKISRDVHVTDAGLLEQSFEFGK